MVPFSCKKLHKTIVHRTNSHSQILGKRDKQLPKTVVINMQMQRLSAMLQ